MQDRYTGDIGDFAKYGLLRALGEGQTLGVAWYLYPDEIHNEDGRHTAYLDAPDQWRHLDPDLFDDLREIVRRDRREVRQIEVSGLLGKAVFSNTPLTFGEGSPTRPAARAKWFRGVLSDLRNCSLVFADPDNGLCEDRTYRIASREYWKRMPLSEAHVISAGRAGIIYHHNTRRPGGHISEVQHWLTLLGDDAIALRWRRISNRTFFIVHPTSDIKRRALEFVAKWSPHFELQNLDMGRTTKDQRAYEPPEWSGRRTSVYKSCPECGHQFGGRGWGGIDAHWKANHDDIMPYESAWPIIKKGGKPSIEKSTDKQVS